MDTTTSERRRVRDQRQCNVELFSPIQEIEQHCAGSVLYRQGDLPRGCYVVHSGCLELTSGDATRTVRLCRSGELVGLEAVICGKAHDFTAVATEDANVGFISRERLLGYLRSNTANCFPILELLSNSVNRTYQSVRTSGSEGARTPSATTQAEIR